MDGMNQSSFILGKQPKSSRESLISFIGEDIAAVRWRNFQDLSKQFLSSSGNPAMYGLTGEGIWERTLSTNLQHRGRPARK